MDEVNAALAKVDPTQRALLEHLRTVVIATLPEAEQAISYGMPAFRYKGKYLCAYAAFKDHCSFFPGGVDFPELENQIAAFRTSKGTLQFTADHMLPDDLIRAVVLARARRIDA